jgi:hypothetical protein
VKKIQCLIYLFGKGMRSLYVFVPKSWNTLLAALVVSVLKWKGLIALAKMA